MSSFKIIILHNGQKKVVSFTHLQQHKI